MRFKTGSGYVCVATNLPAEDFPPDMLRQLYMLRWSEESIKYTIGLVNFHSRIKELILQEIYARLILYNFCELVVSYAVVQTRGQTKHPYKINFATAVNICKEYLKLLPEADENTICLFVIPFLTNLHLITRETLPHSSNSAFAIGDTA